MKPLDTEYEGNFVVYYHKKFHAFSSNGSWAINLNAKGNFCTATTLFYITHKEKINLTNVSYFLNIYYHIFYQEPTLSGSQVHASAVLLLFTVKN